MAPFFFLKNVCHVSLCKKQAGSVSWCHPCVWEQRWVCAGQADPQRGSIYHHTRKSPGAKCTVFSTSFSISCMFQKSTKARNNREFSVRKENLCLLRISRGILRPALFDSHLMRWWLCVYFRDSMSIYAFSTHSEHHQGRGLQREGAPLGRRDGGWPRA